MANIKLKIITSYLSKYVLPLIPFNNISNVLFIYKVNLDEIEEN